MKYKKFGRPWCASIHAGPLVQPPLKIFTRPNATVTILNPNHYYMIYATQGNLEHILSTQNTLRAHSEHSQS